MTKLIGLGCKVALVLLVAAPVHGADGGRFSGEIAPLLKEKCVKCHGPAKAEAELDLSRAAGLLRGGKNGPVIAPHDVEGSLLWERVDSGEMPPKHPLADAEKSLLKKWIVDGAPGLPRTAIDAEHWSFRKLSPPKIPAMKVPSASVIDAFIERRREEKGIKAPPEADRVRLIRRVGLTLTGIPPTPEAVDRFLADRSDDAYAKMVDRYLADPGFGHRWGKFWLDAAGYADSNGYFNADSDRPLAWRYRDYVIRSFNEDKPFDRFITEQLAGDELTDFKPGDSATPETIERLIATHYLRNGQDGSGESDGNPDEVRVDRYTALETCQQIVASSLLGLTLQCAKCHSHKFEPISQEDYYRFQSIFDPVFPAATDSLWIKPQARVVNAPPLDEKRKWETRVKELESSEKELRRAQLDWTRKHRPQGKTLFTDDFGSGEPLSIRWSNTAPGDDTPGGKPPVNVDSDKEPGARVRDGRLEIVAGGTLDSWLVTRESFDWAPRSEGESIQVTFDLVDDKLKKDARSAERVGYFIAAHDFDDSGKTQGGNILVDGHPKTGSSVVVDYPGKDSDPRKAVGTTGYAPGRNYGVRVTNAGKGKFLLRHIVDGIGEEGTVTLSEKDLPRGAFGFEYHAHRGFVIDNIRVEAFLNSPETSAAALKDFEEKARKNGEALASTLKELNRLKEDPPGRIAWATDVTRTPPETRLLTRGNYGTPAAAVQPGPPSALGSKEAPYAIKPPAGGRTTGRRLAFARWLTDPNGNAASLTARVQMNRAWQSVFGVGLVATSENLGLSGAEPADRELLDALAYEFMMSGWKYKHMLRLILNSQAFRRSSDVGGDDPLTGRYPVQRLEAESIRDAMLAVSGDLDNRMGGPPVRLDSGDGGAVIVAESVDGAKRRTAYLQSKRTRVVSFLQVFDAPSIVYNAVRRPRTAMPLQALSLLNSDFVRARASSFASRLEKSAKEDDQRIALGFRLAYGRPATEAEIAAGRAFVTAQTANRGGGPDGVKNAWVDFCQSLLVANEFIYID